MMLVHQKWKATTTLLSFCLSPWNPKPCSTNQTRFIFLESGLFLEEERCLIGQGGRSIPLFFPSCFRLYFWWKSMSIFLKFMGNWPLSHLSIVRPSGHPSQTSISLFPDWGKNIRKGEGEEDHRVQYIVVGVSHHDDRDDGSCIDCESLHQGGRGGNSREDFVSFKSSRWEPREWSCLDPYSHTQDSGKQAI